jgi:hypothetical protein
MFLNQVIKAALCVLHAAARPLLQACTHKHILCPLREEGQSTARFPRGMDSFEVMAARAASGV